MKYLTLTLLLFIGFLSARSCDCNSFSSFCDVLENSIISPEYSKIACYVEYTGNSLNNKYEVKIIDLFYGDIQPGNELYLNTDSTFWVTSAWHSCQDIFTLKDGYHALMVTSTYNAGIYDFFSCSFDLDIYLEPIEPSEYNELVENIESCLSSLL